MSHLGLWQKGEYICTWTILLYVRKSSSLYFQLRVGRIGFCNQFVENKVETDELKGDIDGLCTRNKLRY